MPQTPQLQDLKDYCNLKIAQAALAISAAEQVAHDKAVEKVVYQDLLDRVQEQINEP